MSVCIAHVVRGIIINKNKQFPVLFRDIGAHGDTSHALMQLPGGLVENTSVDMPVSEGRLIGELMREVREELGLDINFTDWKRVHQGIDSPVFKPGELGWRKDISSGDIQYKVHYFVAHVGDEKYKITPEENWKFLMMIRADFTKVNSFCQLVKKMESITSADDTKTMIKIDTGLCECLQLYAHSLLNSFLAQAHTQA